MSGMKLPDGYKTSISGLPSPLAPWELDPEVKGTEPSPSTGYFQLSDEERSRVGQSKKLITLDKLETAFTFDPSAYEQIVKDYLKDIRRYTVEFGETWFTFSPRGRAWFPTGKPVVFDGYLSSFKPDGVDEEGQPVAEFTITVVPTEVKDDGQELTPGQWDGGPPGQLDHGGVGGERKSTRAQPPVHPVHPSDFNRGLDRLGRGRGFVRGHGVSDPS